MALYMDVSEEISMSAHFLKLCWEFHLGCVPCMMEGLICVQGFVLSLFVGDLEAVPGRFLV